MNLSASLRRLLAASLCAVMLLSLAACTGTPAETTALAETTQPPQINYEDLVTDAYCYAYRDEYGTEYCYHIPQVMLESCADFNEEIHASLSEILDRDVKEAIQIDGYPLIGHMVYVWNHREDILSIMIPIDDAYVEWTDYHAYYLSLQTGEQVDKAALLGAFGLSEQQFHDRVYGLLKDYWDAELQTEAYQTVDHLKEYAPQMIEETLSEENIHASIPFIHSNGRLSFVTSISVPAGGGIYKALYDYESGEQIAYLTCGQDHSEDFEASADDGDPVVSISADEAYNIACQYWHYQEGMIDEDTGFEMYLVDDGTVEEKGTLYYFFRLRWLVNDGEGNSWMSTVDQLYINAETGECAYSIYD